MDNVIRTLRQAADLTLIHGPDSAGWLQCHLNPGSADADDDMTVDEWAAGHSIADVRAALLAAADQLEAGVR